MFDEGFHEQGVLWPLKLRTRHSGVCYAEEKPAVSLFKEVIWRLTLLCAIYLPQWFTSSSGSIRDWATYWKRFQPRGTEGRKNEDTCQCIFFFSSFFSSLTAGRAEKKYQQRLSYLGMLLDERKKKHTSSITFCDRKNVFPRTMAWIFMLKTLKIFQPTSFCRN